MLRERLLARVTGSQTPSQRIQIASGRLTETRLNLAEAQGRLAAQAYLNNVDYRQVLAQHFADAYYGAGQGILETTQAENNNHPLLDLMYRLNMSAPGSISRLLGGTLLALAGSANLVQGPEAATFTEIGIFLGATGAVDTARQAFLLLSDRRRVYPAPAETTTSIERRRASIHEGEITGDDMGTSLLLDLALQQRLAHRVLQQLEVDGINRPDFLNPDLTEIFRQRKSLRVATQHFEDLNLLVKSRDIARTSRITRTLLSTLLAVGLLSAHLNKETPADCTVQNFGDDPFMQQETGGATNISSWRGVAQAVWFKRVFGRDFNPQNAGDRVSYEKAYAYDETGNNQIIEDLVKTLKRRNPQISSAGRDFVIHGTPYMLCPVDWDPIFNNPNSATH